MKEPVKVKGITLCKTGNLLVKFNNGNIVFLSPEEITAIQELHVVVKEEA